MTSFQLTVSVLCVFMTLSWAHITPAEPNLKVMTLTPSTNRLINNVTHNVSLECAFNSRVKPWQTSMTQILRIRILKSDINDQWNLMAEIRQDEDGVRIYDNFLGRGQVKGDMWTSYLNITWPIVTGTTFGKYQCDALGYDTNLKYMSEESNSVILTDCHTERQEVFNRFQHALDREIELVDEKFKLMDKSILYDKQDMENKVNDLHDTLMSLNESLGQNLQSVDVEEKFNILYEQLMSTLNQSLERNLQSWDEKFNSLYKQMSTHNQSGQHLDKFQPWPEGHYSLLKPLTGCPRDDNWKKGYHKLHMESSKTQTQSKVSSPSHLPADTLTREGGNNFVVLNFCTKVTSTPGISWPTGSYCINRRGGSCPSGFDTGLLEMDSEDDEPRFDSHGGYSPDDLPTTRSRYFAHYCCRSDRPATTPIDLPTADPFYLYRYKGTCQSVTNMQVSNEYIIIDTEDSGNADNYKNENHPDGSVNPVRLELCYYTHN